LCYLRRKNFAIPTTLGALTLNIFTISYLYTQSYALCANTLGDPNSKIIYATYSVSDAFFAFLYTLLSDYLYPWGFFGFSAFPKAFFAISFYFFFDDRLNQILYLYLLTNVLSYIQGIVCQELLLDCLDEEITEFGALDHYILMYLDAPYIVKKMWQGALIQVDEWKQWLFTPKSAADKYKAVEEKEDE
jgi:hypothetical protein